MSACKISGQIPISEVEFIFGQKQTPDYRNLLIDIKYWAGLITDLAGFGYKCEFDY